MNPVKKGATFKEWLDAHPRKPPMEIPEELVQKTHINVRVQTLIHILKTTPFFKDSWLQMPLYDYDDVLDFLNMYEEHLQQSRNITPQSSCSSSSSSSSSLSSPPRRRSFLRRSRKRKRPSSSSSSPPRAPVVEPHSPSPSTVLEPPSPSLSIVVEPPSPSPSTSRKRSSSPPPAVVPQENRPLTRQMAKKLKRTLPDISTLYSQLPSRRPNKPIDPEKLVEMCVEAYTLLGVGLFVLNIEEDQALREQIKEAQNTCSSTIEKIRSLSSEQESRMREVELKKLQKDVKKLKEKAQALNDAVMALLPGPDYRVTPPPEAPPRQKKFKRRLPPRRPPPEQSTSTSTKTTQPMPPVVHRPWTRSMGPVPI